MSDSTVGGAAGGLGALWAWLRRETRGSSESLSSVGSALTVASFAFVPGASALRNKPCEQHESVATASILRRKYGLLADPADTHQWRRSLIEPRERERRAHSESLHRRTAYVPGKRRAPPPPALVCTTLPRGFYRRHSRKRPAPQPPDKTVKDFKEIFRFQQELNLEMNLPSNKDAKNIKSTNKLIKRELKHDVSTGESSTKNVSDTKQRSSFLRHILSFDNKNRNSADISVLKLLPSISKLDEEATKIMESRKQNQQLTKNTVVDLSNNGQKLFCKQCFTYYSDCTQACPRCYVQIDGKNITKNVFYPSTRYTQTEFQVSRNLDNQEKQKLKEMLKEIKDSLPKRPKHDKDSSPGKSTEEFLKAIDCSSNSETATLQIGLVHAENKKMVKKQDIKSKNTESLTTEKQQQPSTSKQPVPQHCGPSVKSMEQTNYSIITNDVKTVFDAMTNSNCQDQKEPQPFKSALKLTGNTPHNVSTLLNPIYIPKVIEPEKRKIKENDVGHIKHTRTENSNDSNILQYTESDKKLSTSTKECNKNIILDQKKNISQRTESIKVKDTSNLLQSIDSHSKRRELINRLEQSIAKGDEKAAADAAAKLAQLRLSCSVLSFTPQMADAQNKPDLKVSDNSTNNNQNCKNTYTKPADVNQTKEAFPVHASASTSQGHDVKTVIVNNARLEALRKAAYVFSSPKTEDNIGSIDVWIEDRATTHGPLQVQIRREATLGELRQQAEATFGFAAHLQRWIIGRTLCLQDNALLKSLAGSDLREPFYLCLVQSEVEEKPKSNLYDNNKLKANKNEVYSELVELESRALVPNIEVFRCEICIETYNVGEGVVLRECIHNFCKECLSNVIRHCEEPIVSCPATDCLGILQEREIRALITQADYERWLARGLAVAESATRNTFHCLTADCTGWAFCEPGVQTFPCPVCRQTNCIKCKAIHSKETCEQYELRIKTTTKPSSIDETDKDTKQLLELLIAKGEALNCPECNTTITKKWGCDWVKCSACKTEICWVTRGRRWGPGGRGDVSAGCRCGVDGVRCHPACGYCH